MKFLNDMLEAEYPGHQTVAYTDPKGRVHFRVRYHTETAGAGAISVQVVAETTKWKEWPRMYRLKKHIVNPPAPDSATRTALIEMYTMMFEDLCAQHGIKTYNLRRKEMKRWQQESMKESSTSTGSP
jgi:alcohol dehydrogenase class IV